MNTLASCLKAMAKRPLRHRRTAGTCCHQVIRALHWRSSTLSPSRLPTCERGEESTIFECNACIRYPTAQPLEVQLPRSFVKRGRGCHKGDFLGVYERSPVEVPMGGLSTLTWRFPSERFSVPPTEVARYSRSCVPQARQPSLQMTLTHQFHVDCWVRKNGKSKRVDFTAYPLWHWGARIRT